MSLHEFFNTRAAEVQNTRIEDACQRLLRALEIDVARARRVAEGKGNILTRHGFHGAGSYASGIFKYRLLRLKSEGSYTFDTWYHNGEQMEKLLNRLLPHHPSFKALHAFCAHPDNNFRITHDIEKDMRVGLVTPTNYAFTISVTIELREPYTASRPMLVDPARQQPAPPPAPVQQPAATAQAPTAQAPLTKAQVAQYLRSLSNEQVKAEFIELLGGTPPHKAPPRLRLKKPGRE